MKEQNQTTPRYRLIGVLLWISLAATKLARRLYYLRSNRLICREVEFELSELKRKLP